MEQLQAVYKSLKKHINLTFCKIAKKNYLNFYYKIKIRAITGLSQESSIGTFDFGKLDGTAGGKAYVCGAEPSGSAGKGAAGGTDNYKLLDKLNLLSSKAIFI